MPGPGTFSPEHVVRIDQSTVVEGEAATADASGQTVPKGLKLEDAIVEVVAPVGGQSGPIPAPGRASVSELIERALDDPERDANLLGGSDEGDPTQGVPGVPALVAGRAAGGDQAFPLVEAQG